MAALLEVVPPDGIALAVPARGWREVVTQVGGMLVQLGYATDEYTEAIKNNILRNGPYLVIAPGLALLHARPEDGALAPGMVVATLAQPVRFGHSANDPVRVALGLTAVDSTGHLDALIAIANTFSNPNALEAIVAATSPDDLRDRLMNIDLND